jgi:hypothetical protein
VDAFETAPDQWRILAGVPAVRDALVALIANSWTP